MTGLFNKLQNKRIRIAKETVYIAAILVVFEFLFINIVS